MATARTSNHAKMNDMVNGLLLRTKSSVGFLHNCDLPPPLKVFSGPDNAVMSQMNCVFTKGENDILLHERADDNEKMELLKALRFSQTRAREVERKAATLAKEKESISNALLHESLRLSVYRQWTRLLEIQVSKWHPHNLHDGCRNSNKEAVDIEDGNGLLLWTVAFTLCLGITGVCFAFSSGDLFGNLPTASGNSAWSKLSVNNNL